MAANQPYCADDLADINTPLLYDYWYVAGLSSEFSGELRARTILNRSLVLYRDEAGHPVALQNRCAQCFEPQPSPSVLPRR